MPPLLGKDPVFETLVAPSSLLTETPIDDWHAIPLGGLTQFVGGPEGGKSLLLREILLSSIEIKKEQQGRVFYASAHDPVKKLPPPGAFQILERHHGSGLEEMANALFRFFEPEAHDIVLVDDVHDFVTQSDDDVGAASRHWNVLLRRLQGLSTTVVLTGRPSSSRTSAERALLGTTGAFLTSMTVVLDPVATTAEGLIVELQLQKSHQVQVSGYPKLRLWIEPDKTPSIFVT